MNPIVDLEVQPHAQTLRGTVVRRVHCPEYRSAAATRRHGEPEFTFGHIFHYCLVLTESKV